MADPDDYSDSELGGEYDETVETAGGDQDEQHAQKVNGKIDSLQMRVKELEAELKKGIFVLVFRSCLYPYHLCDPGFFHLIGFFACSPASFSY